METLDISNSLSFDLIPYTESRSLMQFQLNVNANVSVSVNFRVFVPLFA
jgi:hypothetical protein